MNKKLYAEFIKVEAKYKDIESKRDELRREIVDEMVKDGISKEETIYGIFTVAHKTSWTYTDIVGKLHERLKIAQLKEQKTGKAQEHITNYLRFTAQEIK